MFDLMFYGWLLLGCILAAGVVIVLALVFFSAGKGEVR